VKKRFCKINEKIIFSQKHFIVILSAITFVIFFTNKLVLLKKVFELINSLKVNKNFLKKLFFPKKIL